MIPMIDEEWLDQSLRYEFPDGGRFEGVAGIGGSSVVISCIGVDGKPFVMRLFDKNVFSLACYLREVPNWIAPSPQYDVHRLNEKLKRALGDPMMLLLSFESLIDVPLQNIYRSGITELEGLEGESVRDTELIWFIVHTPLFAYRLSEACDDRDRPFREWARKAVTTLDRTCDDVPDRLAPALIADNPLILWGGVLARGYFSDDELPLAVAAVESCLREMSQERVALFCNQASALLTILRGMDRGTGIAVLCDDLGLTEEPLATEAERRERVYFLRGIGSGPTGS
jgi:hypothetical protein